MPVVDRKTFAVEEMVVSTVQVAFAGLASVLPALSVALTWKVCEPPARPVYDLGEVQLAKAAPSRLHWNVEPVSVEVKERDALVELAGLDGDAVIVVFGAVVSTVHVAVAGLGSTWPSGPVALTWKVCEPSMRPVYDLGEVQLAKAAPSRLHSKVEPEMVEAKESEAELEFVALPGCDVIVVSGSVVSIVQAAEDGLESVLPAASLASTLNVWAPPASPEYVWGEAHDANAAPSREQRNVALASVDVKANVAVTDPVGFAGCAVIAVSGATLSIAQA